MSDKRIHYSPPSLTRRPSQGRVACGRPRRGLDVADDATSTTCLKCQRSMAWRLAIEPLVLAWMRRELAFDPATYTDSAGEVLLGTLAEYAADAFNQAGEGGWLDDPDHWVWTAAFDAACQAEGLDDCAS